MTFTSSRSVPFVMPRYKLPLSSSIRLVAPGFSMGYRLHRGAGFVAAGAAGAASSFLYWAKATMKAARFRVATRSSPAVRKAALRVSANRRTRSRPCWVAVILSKLAAISAKCGISSCRSDRRVHAVLYSSPKRASAAGVFVRHDKVLLSV